MIKSKGNMPNIPSLPRNIAAETVSLQKWHGMAVAWLIENGFR